jgi:peptidoglycan biosynthesis protein MviN/MurJ (putative lipid II flippase)
MISLALAEGKPRYPLISAIVETAVALIAVVALVGSLDEVGIGLAITASTLIGTLVLVLGTHPRVRRSMLAVAKASLIAAVAAAVGQLVGAGEDAIGLLVSLAAVTVVWVALEFVFSRSDVTRIASILRPLFRRAVPT